MYDYILVHIPVINQEEAFILLNTVATFFYTKTLYVIVYIFYWILFQNYWDFEDSPTNKSDIGL